MMANQRRYPINQSPLYLLKSKKRLADILGLSIVDIRYLSKADQDNYNLFTINKDSPKPRNIQHPKPKLAKVHKLICSLLMRIETPGYLHSAIKGRSYITNASEHIGADSMVKIDVKKFYESAEREAVFRFFFFTMRESSDVANILANILTFDGHLSTGSSVSPILSFWAYKQMFDEINDLVDSNGLRVTLYVDDITVSGKGTTKKIRFEIAKIIHRYGLRAHKLKYYECDSHKTVTGVIIKPDGLHLPNKRHKKIKDDHVSYMKESDLGEKTNISNRLIGRLYEAGQIDKNFICKANQLKASKRKSASLNRSSDIPKKNCS